MGRVYPRKSASRRGKRGARSGAAIAASCDANRRAGTAGGPADAGKGLHCGSCGSVCAPTRACTGRRCVGWAPATFGSHPVAPSFIRAAGFGTGDRRSGRASTPVERNARFIESGRNLAERMDERDPFRRGHGHRTFDPERRLEPVQELVPVVDRIDRDPHFVAEHFGRPRALRPASRAPGGVARACARPLAGPRSAKNPTIRANRRPSGS
jgi:hypothetical protein